MITFNDIRPHEIVKVLVEIDDIQEELFAKVIANEITYLYVTYLSHTSEIYKGACVYRLESHISTVDPDSLTEHHEGVIDIEDIGFIKVDTNTFVMKDELDDSISGSDIEDMDDIKNECDLDDFIDDNVQMELPLDAREVDSKWAEWDPTTPGGRHFKNIVDSIDERVRFEMDNQQFK